MGQEIELQEKDDGGASELATDDVIRVLLPENPTTGYRWSVDTLDGERLELVETKFHLSRPLPGAGGTREFRFRVLAPGRATLTLKHWREWEGDASVTRRYKHTLTIR